MTKIRTLAAGLAAVAAVFAVGAAAFAAVTVFSDTSGHEHQAEIRLANSKGLFAGYGDGTFRPDRTLTNRQSEVVLRRMLDKYTDDDGNSTLTRAEAAVVLTRGVCGLDGDCGDPPPPPTSAPEAPQERPPVPQDTGLWERFETEYEWDDTPIVGYTLSSTSGPFSWDVAHVMIRCFGDDPEISITTTELIFADDLIPVRYRSGSATAVSAVWPVWETDSINGWIGFPSSANRGQFLRYIIDNPGPFLFEWTDEYDDHPTTFRWDSTRGLDAAAKELYGICGL